MMTRVMLTLVALFTCLTGAAAAWQPAAGDDFVPAGSLPPASEGLPAAPMLIAAYAFVWAALAFYVWTVWRRVRKVDGELAELERRAAAK